MIDVTVAFLFPPEVNTVAVGTDRLGNVYNNPSIWRIDVFIIIIVV